MTFDSLYGKIGKQKCAVSKSQVALDISAEDLRLIAGKKEDCECETIPLRLCFQGERMFFTVDEDYLHRKSREQRKEK